MKILKKILTCGEFWFICLIAVVIYLHDSMSDSFAYIKAIAKIDQVVEGEGLHQEEGVSAIPKEEMENLLQKQSTRHVLDIDIDESDGRSIRL